MELSYNNKTKSGCCYCFKLEKSVVNDKDNLLFYVIAIKFKSTTFELPEGASEKLKSSCENAMLQTFNKIKSNDGKYASF